MTSHEELDYEAALKGGRELLAQRGIAGPLLISVAAAGLVVEIWRDTIEPFHRLFSDAEMSRMSMVTTRDILPLITEDSADVIGITEVLQDGRRR
ncbi:hypothetical protein [Virgisporangium aurantiacum]|uniref:Uncharacterized protein n=1 Tax=Virgisporangium aurantiacum TaxID=175570 RepID=A0A8J4E7B8_9ACTN|nr:hypothetical protein [Virgisporangium aurantiacum]GIJ64376.1 hypothetical protein Vau01_118920 [Virgisporangium aurantiacum]